MTSALEVSALSKSFGGVRAVNDVSFTVPTSSITALIGPNGAGKTTLFNLITNLYRSDSGDIHIFGQRLDPGPLWRIAQQGVIRTFQTARVFPGMTAFENVLAGASFHSRTSLLYQMLWLRRSRREEDLFARRAQRLLDLVGLTQFRDLPATDLPIGAQKLLELIRAFMASPRLLLLDEPAAGLNDRETGELAVLLRAVRGSGITLVIVEHNMSLVMGVADQVVVLDAGSVVASGSPQQIQKDARVIEAYVGWSGGSGLCWNCGG